MNANINICKSVINAVQSLKSCLDDVKKQTQTASANQAKVNIKNILLDSCLIQAM